MNADSICSDAGLDAPILELKAASVEELFVEQVSSVQKREELEKALEFIRKGGARVCRHESILAMNLDRHIPHWKAPGPSRR